MPPAAQISLSLFNRYVKKTHTFKALKKQLAPPAVQTVRTATLKSFSPR